MPDTSGFIIAAYAVTWVVLVGFAIRLQVVSRRARDQFEEASRAGGSP